MPATQQTFSPRWSRLVVALIGAFAAAVVPTGVALALGLELHDDQLAPVMAAVLAYSALFIAGIFISGQWAAKIEPDVDVVPLSLSEVRRRILALNDLGVPFAVREDELNHFLVEWKGDAVRTLATTTGGVRNWSRVSLRLVESRHQARTVDTLARLHWSDDREHYQWHGSFQFFRGITFVSYRQGPQFGLVLRNGQWSVADGHHYRMTIDELKQPLVQAVVLSGWTWQPVIIR